MCLESKLSFHCLKKRMCERCQRCFTSWSFQTCWGSRAAAQGLWGCPQVRAGVSSSGNAQVRNGHFLANNFTTDKQACIQVPFCVSLNFAETMSSILVYFKWIFFVLLHERELGTPQIWQGKWNLALCCALGASPHFRMESSHQCHVVAHYVFSSYSSAQFWKMDVFLLLKTR